MIKILGVINFINIFIDIYAHARIHIEMKTIVYLRRFESMFYLNVKLKVIKNNCDE
jgi:hypothetical protein